jgi:nucleoside-diphosphate-sugar epimerase
MYIGGDVTDPSTFGKIETDVDYIIHLAAVANPRECEEKPDLAFKINVIGTFNVLNFAKEKNVKKVVFTSSAQLYGRSPRIPTDEKHPIDPLESVYNSTKRMGEELCEMFKEKFSLPTVYLRLFNSFGPRQSIEYFIPTVISQALKNGLVEVWSDKTSRDFVFVRDTVRAIMLAAEGEFSGGPINIGTGREINTGDLGRIIASDLGVEIKFLNKEVSGPLKLLCDNRMAGEVLGWKPEVDFNSGLKITIEWFKKNS